MNAQRRAGTLWSSKSLASSFHHGVFRVLVRCRVLFLARALLAAVVGYYTLLPGTRARSRAYITRRFAQHTGFQGWLHTWRLYKTFGNILLERMVANVTGHFPLIDTPAHFQNFVAALQEGKGCIALSAHVGAWQTGAKELENLHVPLWLLLHRDPGDVDRQYFENTAPQQDRPQAGHRAGVINAAGPFGGLVECAAALRRGEVVCVMGDRLLKPAEPSVETEFMGGRVRFPLSPYILASITGAPLVITFALHETAGIRGHSRGVLHIPPGLRENPDAALPFVRTFVAELEHLVDDYPYQFFNFFNMWDSYDTTRNGQRSA